MAPRPNLPVIAFEAKLTKLAGRFYETNDRVGEAIQEAIGLAMQNKPPLFHGKLHGKGGETLQVAVDWKSKHVWVGLDPDPEFETWMRDLTRDLVIGKYEQDKT